MRPILRVCAPRVARVAAAVAALAAAATTACDRREPAPAADSATPTPPAVAPVDPVPPAERVSGWNADAGEALLVPGEDGTALVVVPGVPGDSMADRTAGATADVLPAEVTLFSRAGSTGRARATPTGEAATCWPTARLDPTTGSDPLPTWTVGFVGGTPTPIALDSIEGAAAADSASLAATVTRLATTLRDDTVRALRGVPLTVRSAHRFAIAPAAGGGDGRAGLVAVLTRALNQEASPLVERLLLVAERPRGANVPWLVAYHERHTGREEVVPATEILAAAALGASQQPAFVLARALADGSRYALLERTGDLAWRVRWTSVVRGC